MYKFLFLLIALPIFLFAQAPDLGKSWKIKLGDDMAWSKPDFNDADWKPIDPTTFYENQGYDGYNGYSWYRIKFKLPSSIKSNSILKDSIRVIVGRVDDIDATYLNGEKIGGIGRFPDDPKGIFGWYDKIRRYTLPVNHPAIHWDAENVLAVRVYDGGGGGGLWGLTPSIDMIDVIDFTTLNIDAGGFDFSNKGNIQKLVKVENGYNGDLEGTLSLKIQREEEKPIVQQVDVKSAALGSFSHTFMFPNIENAKVTYTFTEKTTGKKIETSQMTPYIWTPKESPKPNITNATVFGTKPNRPFLLAIRATGEKPMKYTVQKLPIGLKLDENTGLITGTSSPISSTYELNVSVENKAGKATKTIKIVVKDQLSLTPPMGWNSWNCWAMSVSQDKVKQSADALKSSGLINHGYTYMVIDDGWQGDLASNGATGTNQKFPNMKTLADDLHHDGLKLGIYSAPGKESCGGKLASFGHETQDAKQWADWGVDYVKYDWCSYSAELATPQNKWTEEEQILPFQKMNDALLQNKRDILLSVCNWGMNDVWKWAHKSGGQLWRTTGDIEDSWASLSTIGFSQPALAEYSMKGGWNDPDMMIVGWVGWGDKLHQTHLTPSEQYTHITMWSMLNAPMMIGCDLSRIDEFTYNLLANDEIIALNQDELAKVATVIFKNENIQVWSKELADGSKAISIFNLKNEKQSIDLKWSDLALSKPKTVRDLWKQQKVKTCKALKTELNPHGCYVVKIKD